MRIYSKDSTRLLLLTERDILTAQKIYSKDSTRLLLLTKWYILTAQNPNCLWACDNVYSSSLPYTIKFEYDARFSAQERLVEVCDDVTSHHVKQNLMSTLKQFRFLWGFIK